MPRVQAVLGCGRWGSFHLWYGSSVGNRTIGWEPLGTPAFQDLVSSRRNGFLQLPDEVRLTTDLREVEGADIIIVTVPAQRFASLSARLAELDLSGADVVLCMKGLERETGLRLSEVAQRAGVRSRSLSVWVGPGHAQQFLKGVPSCMLIAAASDDVALRISDMMSSPLIRFYRSRDMIGCEIGAAVKNVMGIAAGLLDGLGMSGLKGALMARAPQEVARLVSGMGGDWRSVYGLSHLGDYEATLFSPYSRNRLFGEALAGGAIETRDLAEGVDTSAAVILLAERLGIEMPITATVRSIIDREMGPDEAISRLFSRPEKEEFPEEF